MPPFRYYRKKHEQNVYQLLVVELPSPDQKYQKDWMYAKAFHFALALPAQWLDVHDQDLPQQYRS